MSACRTLSHTLTTLLSRPPKPWPPVKRSTSAAPPQHQHAQSGPQQALWRLITARTPLPQAPQAQASAPGADNALHSRLCGRYLQPSACVRIRTLSPPPAIRPIALVNPISCPFRVADGAAAADAGCCWLAKAACLHYESSRVSPDVTRRGRVCECLTSSHLRPLLGREVTRCSSRD